MPGFQACSSGGPIRRSLSRLGVPRSQPGRYWECWCIHSIVWSLSNLTWAMQAAELSGWIMTSSTGDVDSVCPSTRRGPVVGVGPDIPALSGPTSMLGVGGFDMGVFPRLRGQVVVSNSNFWPIPASAGPAQQVVFKGLMPAGYPRVCEVCDCLGPRSL